MMRLTIVSMALALICAGCEKNTGKANADKPAETPKSENTEKKAGKAATNAESPKAANAQPKKEEKAEKAEKSAKSSENTVNENKDNNAPKKADDNDPTAAPADVAAAPADAEKTSSGLASKVLKAGTGTKKPAPTDKVTVHYTGWTTDGKMFDSSVMRGQPTTFPLNRVIKGWTEGVGLMVEGEKRRFWIPGNLAYGDTPARPGAPAGTLVFDVELIKVVEGPKPPAVPEDVAAAPADAVATPSGLKYKVLKKGTGDKKPAATDTVRVHYSGWTTDGKMFDSSVMRGQPTSFPLNRVIKGWTEGVALMVVGEKTRFWIPGKLAYGDTPSRPGAPAGTLVFDVELLAIQ